MTEKDQEIRKSAAREAVLLMEDWKRKIWIRKVYCRCLVVILLLSCMAFTALAYYRLDSKIPATLYMQAGKEHTFHLNIPATGDILPVGVQNKSNLPSQKADLAKVITMKTGSLSDYSMQVKLFGVLPIKQVDIKVVKDKELIPIGAPVGIYVKADGILVVGIGSFQDQSGKTCSPAKHLLKAGDYIKTLNGKSINTKAELMEGIDKSLGKSVCLGILRQGKECFVEIEPVMNEAGEYKIGTWIRDNAQGVGTMTYIDTEGHFGALGHGINDVDTCMLMNMNDGTLYDTQIVGIKKGENGAPGEMTGTITYSEEHILGDITKNSEKGIFGICNERALKLRKEDAIPIGYKQEIVNGYAQIMCTIEDEPVKYDVEITQVHLDHDNINRGIELTVTDERLVNTTGGIIQGMSGAPIIQNGKLIGAVTHVLINDSKKGYGIFIENMLEQ